MKPVTGSKPQPTVYEVSIRRRPDGHSFSFPPLEKSSGAPDGDTVPTGEGAAEIEILTPGTLLVPAEAFAAERSAELLATAGIAVADDERIVTSDPQAPIIALMTLDEATCRAIEARFGDRVRYTTPLLSDQQISGPTVRVFRTPELLYIKVYDDGLRFAEAVPVGNDAEIEYLFERLGSVFPPERFTLRIAGEAGRATGKLLRKRFKKTICE